MLKWECQHECKTLDSDSFVNTMMRMIRRNYTWCTQEGLIRPFSFGQWWQG